MRHITLLFALPIGLHLCAQSFPFPTTDATWVQYFEVMVSPPPIPTFELQSTGNFCMDGSDTLIAGNSYTRLENCYAGYVGGIRSEGQAVYFHAVDSTQEQLLYDFGAAVGDTLFDVFVNEELGVGAPGWMGPRLLDLVVFASAPSTAYGGRTAMLFRAVDPDISMETEWVEGIGCIYGLFTYNPQNVSMYWYGMQCFSHLDTTYWNEAYVEQPGTCAPLSVGITESMKTSARVYPNPTTGPVRVEGIEAGAEPQVMDAMGREVNVRKSGVSSTGIDLDLSHLPAGVYHVSVRDRAGSIRVIRL